MPVMFTSKLIDQIIKGRCAAFAELMGMHKSSGGELSVNVFLPGAHSVEVLSGNGKKVLVVLQRLHAEGLFCASFAGKKILPYRLRVSNGLETVVVDDPYRFRRKLDSAELQLFSLGRHEAAWHFLGAHPRTIDGIDGVHFVLWAPAATRVSVLLQKTHWDGRVHLMYPHVDAGLWELFVPGLPLHAAYKFEVMNDQHETQVLDLDPFARQVDLQPLGCSRVDAITARAWRDHFWLLMHSNQAGQAMPMTIAELALTDELLESGVHWPQLATLVLPKLKAHGFTHLLLPDAQACAMKARQRQPALLAATAQLGSNAELQVFVDQAHEPELAVLWDISLVALLNAHGLAFGANDGIDWATTGGALMSMVNACVGYWHTHMHIDGFRMCEVDALLMATVGTAGRGRKQRPESTVDLYAREWLGALLSQLRERFPALLLLVDSALALPEFTQSPQLGGLGFDFCMDTAGCALLRPLPEQQTGKEVAALVQAWRDGNGLQQLAAFAPAPALRESLLQLWLLVLWTLPARKLLQLECRLSVRRNWQPDSGHDFELQLAPAMSVESLALLRQFNLLYLHSPGLYEQDASHEGINVLLATSEICAFERISRHAADHMLIVVNFGEQTSETVSLRIGSNRCYHLVCGVGADKLPAELMTAGKSLAATIILPARTGAIYSLAS